MKAVARRQGGGHVWRRVSEGLYENSDKTETSNICENSKVGEENDKLAV